VLSNSSQNIARQKRRKLRFRSLAKKVPQLLVVFAFHFFAN